MANKEIETTSTTDVTKKEGLKSFPRFKRIMEILISFRNQRERVSDFLEKEIMKESWCILTFGGDIESTLINMLADEYNCWYYIPRSSDGENYVPKNWWETEKYWDKDNDINYWLYEVDDEHYEVTVDGKPISIKTLEEFHDYLVKYYK